MIAVFVVIGRVISVVIVFPITNNDTIVFISIFFVTVFYKSNLLTILLHVIAQ